MTTWVLVANRSQARLLVREGSSLRRFRAFEHPEGRKRDQDIEADKPQRTFDRHAEGRYAEDRGRGHQEQAAVKFAKVLAHGLGEEFARSPSVRVVLVAEPHFLGLLRAELGEETQAAVKASVSKDLGAIPDCDLFEHLGDAV